MSQINLKKFIGLILLTILLVACGNESEEQNQLLFDETNYFFKSTDAIISELDQKMLLYATEYKSLDGDLNFRFMDVKDLIEVIYEAADVEYSNVYNADTAVKEAAAEVKRLIGEMNESESEEFLRVMNSSEVYYALNFKSIFSTNESFTKSDYVMGLKPFIKKYSDDDVTVEEIIEIEETYEKNINAAIDKMNKSFDEYKEYEDIFSDEQREYIEERYEQLMPMSELVVELISDVLYDSDAFEIGFDTFLENLSELMVNEDLYLEQEESLFTIGNEYIETE